MEFDLFKNIPCPTVQHHRFVGHFESSIEHQSCLLRGDKKVAAAFAKASERMKDREKVPWFMKLLAGSPHFYSGL